VQSNWRLSELRATIDILVASAYRLAFHDLELILNDFPLLDRGQPPLNGECASTITRDLVLSMTADFCKEPRLDLRDRVLEAKRFGAIPYVPSEFAKSSSRRSNNSEVSYHASASN
jgi:hypothetical protein